MGDAQNCAKNPQRIVQKATEVPISWDFSPDVAQILGTILIRVSCTALSRSASISGSWYGMARMR
jgi:hypothetical protein